jgi:hypothetical protein
MAARTGRLFGAVQARMTKRLPKCACVFSARIPLAGRAQSRRTIQRMAASTDPKTYDMKQAAFVLTILALVLTLLSAETNTQTRKRADQPTAVTGEGIRYQSLPAGKTKIKFPRLTFYRDAEIMRAVNGKLCQITDKLGCEESEKGKTSFQVKAQVEYAAKDIFSIYVSESYYCGGAYPTNDANNSLTFDLKTGELIDFEQLFQDYEKKSAEILRIIFAKQIERAEKLAAKLKAENQEPEASCEGDPELWNLENLTTDNFAFNFSSTGLSVQPAWEHAREACAERVTVPYEQLRKYAAPKGLLMRAQP